MKQIIQNYKSGEVKLKNVPMPICDGKRILVRNKNSLVSIGTEKNIIELGRKSLAGKALARPDLVSRVMDKAKKEGLLKTYKEIMGRLDIPTPLGYSSSGIVEECGISATEFSPGDRVSCIGQGFASHAEFISVPVNLVCRTPREVSDQEASFGMIGTIALHGVRSADLSFGSKVVVMGLGLIGLITVQILNSYGCEVIAYDPEEDKIKIAKDFGIKYSTSNTNLLDKITENITNLQGVDAVIITASTKKKDPIDKAIQLSRHKGKIVVVGIADIHPDRNEMWHKEVEIIVSKAAGPGSLDPLYELEGIDLPIGEVRWTQKRNLEEFLRLLKNKRVNVLPLITHRFSIEKAETAYHQLLEGKLDKPIGILIEYNNTASFSRYLTLKKTFKVLDSKNENITVGVIGAGLFGKSIFLPALKKIPDICLHTLATNSGANVEHGGNKFGFLNHTTDVNEIWSNPEINGVIGLTPHSNHATLLESALENKKHLFLEKPLCTSKDELNLIIKKINKIDFLPKIMVGHNRRFSSHTKKIKTWLQSRKSPLVVQMRINSGFIPSGHWVHSEEEGRSRIVGEMSHFIDLFQCLTGSLVKRVFAERISGDNKVSVNNDNVVITLKFDDGSVGSITYSASGDKSYSREFVEIFFENKTIFLRDFRRSELSIAGKTFVYKTRNQEMGYNEELRHFTSCLKEKENLAVTTKEMFATMNTIFAIEKSLATSIPVNLEKF